MPYIGSLYWRNCDPIVTVIARSKPKAERILRECAAEEIAVVRENSDGLDFNPDDLLTNGVHECSLADSGVEVTDEFLRDMREIGYSIV